MQQSSWVGVQCPRSSAVSSCCGCRFSEASIRDQGLLQMVRWVVLRGCKMRSQTSVAILGAKAVMTWSKHVCC